jgi:two-component system invasion response regulator UvrY
MLVDDHALVRMGFRLLFETTDDIRVVAETASGEQAWRSYSDIRPDVIVMDLTMAGASGLESTTRIVARDPGARVLVVSMHAEAGVAAQLLRAGALGYLTKGSAPEALIGAVRAVAAGQRYVDPAVARSASLLADLERDPAALLSAREFEVFLHLARGHTVVRVAELLSLSPSTVGTHLYNIKRKLGVGHQTELALIAMRRGLVSPGVGPASVE